MRFEDMNLGKSLQNALRDLQMTDATTIQEKTFPKIMSGLDVIGIAQTGTGKTFAYLLPSLRLWRFTKSPYPQILIIVPTRELVAQVVDAINTLTTYMNVVTVGVYGGTNMKTHKHAVSQGVDIVVGTPGRLNDLLLDGVLKMKMLNRLIIDEVDEMLNLGFRTQLRMIKEFLPKKRQNLMFSATLIEEVEEILDEFSDGFVKIEAAPSGAPLENIDQYYYEAENFNTKANLLKFLFDQDETMSKVLVFAGSKKYADILYQRMEEHYGEEAVRAIHSSKSQNHRFASVEAFQTGDVRILIATDIIARGLDISLVTHVVNFKMTDVPEKYIHRIGRTGRAEQRGVAISFVSEDDQANKQAVEELMNLELTKKAAPEGLVISEELIDLEKPIDFVPFNNHKNKTFVPENPAFHEKSAKNSKTNVVIRKSERMKAKYKKPIKRRPKQKGRK